MQCRRSSEQALQVDSHAVVLGVINCDRERPPRVLNLKEAGVLHRVSREVVRRRTEYELRKARPAHIWKD